MFSYFAKIIKSSKYQSVLSNQKQAKKGKITKYKEIANN